MLSTQQVKQFKQEGYLVFDRLIQGQKLQKALAAFDELVHKAKLINDHIDHWSLEKDDQGLGIPGRLHKVQGVCEVEPQVLEVASDPAILDRVEMLIGANIDVFGTKFFPKLPGGSHSTSWHQDNYYFATQSDRVVSCGIYYQDSDSDNGCLRVLPRSHLSGVLADHKPNPKTHGLWVDIDDAGAMDVVCPAGTVVLFSANLLHGAHDNHSDRSRYSTAWHYVPGGLDLEKFRRGVYSDRHIVRGQ